MPKYGGTFHAFPYALQLASMSGPDGTWSVSAPWPTLPIGTQVWVQGFNQDVAVFSGITLSNCLRVTSQ